MITHYQNNESSSDEWRREVDSLDALDPTGYYFGYDPSYVGCLPFDSMCEYKSKDFSLGNGDENDK